MRTPPSRINRWQKSWIRDLVAPDWFIWRWQELYVEGFVQWKHHGEHDIRNLSFVFNTRIDEPFVALSGVTKAFTYLIQFACLQWNPNRAFIVFQIYASIACIYTSLYKESQGLPPAESQIYCQIWKTRICKHYCLIHGNFSLIFGVVFFPFLDLTFPHLQYKMCICTHLGSILRRSCRISDLQVLPTMFFFLLLQPWNRTRSQKVLMRRSRLCSLKACVQRQNWCNRDEESFPRDFWTSPDMPFRLWRGNRMGDLTKLPMPS